MIRLERRVETPRWLALGVPVISIISSVVAGSLLLVATGKDPIDTFSRIVERGFTSDGAMSATMIAATPLLFCGLCAAAAFRMGVFNIGGEGQFIVGAIAAAWVGLQTGEALGPGAIALMVVFGAAAGAAWAAIVGALKAWFNTNEIIVSLMLNYIATNLAYYLIFNSESTWRLLEGSGKQFPQGRKIHADAWWPFSHIGSVDIPFGFWLGVVLAVVTWVLYRKTRYGFEVDVIGEAPRAARYAGMRTKRKVVAVMALSGAFAGIGGAADVGDVRHMLDPKGLSAAGYGYTGIVVAALARLNPIAVVFVAILLGGLNNAGRALQGPDFPAGLVGTLQGLILFFSLGGEVLARYRIRNLGRARAAVAGAMGDGGDE
ncbi:MAG: ABC transporter permease [Microthrixaceae bacterium]|nr:ABC transporter permease [Microthrixaceae bacterium]MCO5312037.1 ABC transporter permease [Microthrixaceae bacterium]